VTLNLKAIYISVYIYTCFVHNDLIDDLYIMLCT